MHISDKVLTIYLGTEDQNYLEQKEVIQELKEAKEREERTKEIKEWVKCDDKSTKERNKAIV